MAEEKGQKRDVLGIGHSVSQLHSSSESTAYVLLHGQLAGRVGVLELCVCFCPRENGEVLFPHP